MNQRGLRGRLPILVALSAILAASPSAGANPPNVVIILADDLGWGSLGCYGADPALVRTPNIDRLAREGRRFTDASTTSSVCSPTRYSLLTGRYCWRTSLGREVLNYDAPLHIEPGRLNLASMLKRHGYRTAAIGKWHLGYGVGKTDYTRPLRPGPLDVGFDDHFGVPSNHGDVAGVFVEGDRVLGLRSAALRPGEAKNWRSTPLIGLDAPRRVDQEVMPTLGDQAVAWLERQDDAHPFFLYYTPVAVHTPITPSSKTRGTSRAGSFGDWIHELDASVGRVLDALDRKGLARDTLVVFTSDNGGVVALNQTREETDAYRAGLRPNGPFRDGKVSVYEGGFRVPFLARWPGRVPAGTTCDEMLSVVDVLATIAAIVGEPLPSASQAAEDSHDMRAAWLDEPHHAPVRPDMILHSCDGNFAIRQGPWKYIEGTPHPTTPPRVLKARAREFRPQLYNLADDPREQHDLLERHPDVVGRLRDLLETQRRHRSTRPVPGE